MSGRIVNGVTVDDTFAEAFPMRGTAIVVTAVDEAWAIEAARSFTGFATSVIACGCEAAIDAIWAARGEPRLYRVPAFDGACAQLGVEHRLTKPYHPPVDQRSGRADEPHH